MPQHLKGAINTVAQIWNGLPALDGLVGGVLNGPVALSPVVQLPDVKMLKPKKLSRFDVARQSLVKPNTGGEKGIDWYFTMTEIVPVIDALGWWNPVQAGRPKPFAQRLLDGIPSPCPGKGYRWKCIGLMYFTPPIVGRLRSKNRTTVTGLALLKHWAECRPEFRPFFNAYYSEKSEREITLDCIDFCLGGVPERYRIVQDANAEKTKAAQARAYQNAQTARSYMVGMQAQQSMAQRANMLALAQAQQSPLFGQAMQSNMLAQNQLYGSAMLGGLIGAAKGV